MTTFEKIVQGILQLLLAGALLVIGFFALMHFMSPRAPNTAPPRVQQPVIHPKETPNVYLSQQPSPTPDNAHTVTPESQATSDIIKYDENKKMKQDMLDKAMAEAETCAHDMVTSRLQAGIRSRQKITDEALLVCTRGLAVKARVFGLGLTPAQVVSTVEEDINREIKMAQSN